MSKKKWIHSSFIILFLLYSKAYCGTDEPSGSRRYQQSRFRPLIRTHRVENLSINPTIQAREPQAHQGALTNPDIPTAFVSTSSEGSFFLNTHADMQRYLEQNLSIMSASRQTNHGASREHTICFRDDSRDPDEDEDEDERSELSAARRRIYSAPAQPLSSYDDSRDSDEDEESHFASTESVEIPGRVLSSEIGISTALSFLTSHYPKKVNIPMYRVRKTHTNKEFFLLGTHNGIPVTLLPARLLPDIYSCDVFILETPLASLDQFLQINQGDITLSERQIQERSSQIQLVKEIWESNQPPLYNWFEQLPSAHQSHLQTLFGKPADFFNTISIFNMPDKYAAMHRASGTIESLASYCREVNKKTIPCLCTLEKYHPSLSQQIKSTFNIDPNPGMTESEWKESCKLNFQLLQFLIRTNLDSGGYFRREENIEDMFRYFSGNKIKKKECFLSLGKVQRSLSEGWKWELSKLLHTIEQNLSAKKVLVAIDHQYLRDEGCSMGVLKFLKANGYKISKVR